MTSEWTNWMHTQLGQIEAAGQWRSTPAFDARGQTGVFKGRDVVSFGGNDYLGLSEHPAVAAAACEAIKRWGTGSTAARLLVGSRPVHGELETALAEWKGDERAVIFSTGYQANLGVLSTFGGPDVTVFSDELNHASLIDGCRLGRSRIAVYRHSDLCHLESLLQATSGRKVVASDSVFSMDGDVAPVEELMSLCAAYGALLVLDEAHAVLGPHIDSSTAPCDLVRVGTMSKTLGSFGGFVTGSAAAIDLLINRARSFIFTTALSPADTAAALAAVQIVRSPEGAALIERLRANVERVRTGHPSPIVAIVIGGEREALAAADHLRDLGLFVPAVRPPTVAVGTSRLRVALSAAHRDEMIDRLLRGLASLGIEASS